MGLLRLVTNRSDVEAQRQRYLRRFLCGLLAGWME